LTDTAWYLGCRPDDVGDRALLVGDRSRISTIADHLDDVTWFDGDRGLTTVTGDHHGHRVTASAFGMGAPSAAIVLHELAELGVRCALRVGTVICVPPAELGDLVIADGALRAEHTSAAYASSGYPAVADHGLNVALRRAAGGLDRRVTTGIVASYDGFYPSMAAWRDDGEVPASEPGVVALDMETSALLVVGRWFGIAAGSLCLATVDRRTGRTLNDHSRAAGERELVRVGLTAITTVDVISDERSTA
jgi:uridine phosphorylase